MMEKMLYRVSEVDGSFIGGYFTQLAIAEEFCRVCITPNGKDYEIEQIYVEMTVTNS